MNEKPLPHEVYDEIAETYTETVKVKPFNAYLERPALRALLPPITGQRVLDAGVGPGTNLHWLLEQGAESIVGVDGSPKMIEIAEENAPKT